MSETTTIVLAVVGTEIAGIGVLSMMVRTVGAQLASVATQVNNLTTRVDNLGTETNRRLGTLTTEMHQRFDQVHRELGEEPLEGPLELRHAFPVLAGHVHSFGLGGAISPKVWHHYGYLCS